MTTEELLTFIKTQLSGCNGNVFMDNILKDLSIHIAKRPLFMPEKFKQWFIDRNVIYRNNPLAFLSKCGIEDIDRGVFDKPQISGTNLTPLCNAMRERGIAVGDETILIDIVETYIINNDLMSEDELCNWNHTAVEYISKLKNPSTKDFALLFERSKSMKALKLPLEDMKKEASRIGKHYNDMLAELDNMSNKQKEEEMSWDEIMAILKCESEEEMQKTYEKIRHGNDVESETNRDGEEKN